MTIVQVAQAQTLDNPGTPEERAAKMTQRMKEEILLRADQVAPVQELNLKYARIAQEEIFDPGLGMFASYRKGMKLNEQKEKELKQLLTEAQWRSYEKLKSESMKIIWSKIF
jgi:hypothetical protein